MKNIHDITAADGIEDADDSDYKRKYIIKNPKWDDQLKAQGKKSYKKNGKKLVVLDCENRYTASL